MGTDKGEKSNTTILFFSDPCPSVISVVKFFRIHILKKLEQPWEVLRNYGGIQSFSNISGGFEICATMVSGYAHTDLSRLRRRLRNYGRTELQIRGTVGCGQVFEVPPEPTQSLENTRFLTTDYADEH